MAAALKDSFGPDLPLAVARMLAAVEPGLDPEKFRDQCMPGFEEAGLMRRAAIIAEALPSLLPDDPERAVATIRASLPPLSTTAAWRGMDSFVLLPFGMYIAAHGLDCFEESMGAQYEITQRFTSEFSIRRFIDLRYQPTMEVLAKWTDDPDHHVRRLVTEGTRPRLPWAPRLRRFVADPLPVVALLDRLRDDPSPYVRRSVANNLNDISKDHPGLAVEVAAAWSAAGVRGDVLRRGLRTLTKAGDPRALTVLGFYASNGEDSPDPLSARVRVLVPAPRVGTRMDLEIDVVNTASVEQRALVDLRVGFARDRGHQVHRVFRCGEALVPAVGSVTLRKTVSLAQLSTRSHHPGMHSVTVQVNGRSAATLDVEVSPAAASAQV